MVSEAGETGPARIAVRDVLILVVVEDGLRAIAMTRQAKWVKSVLILVVVEDGLRGINDKTSKIVAIES